MKNDHIIVSRELLRQAIDALASAYVSSTVITALRSALEQPVQEPVSEAIKKLHMLALPVPADGVTAIDVCKVVSERAIEIINLLKAAPQVQTDEADELLRKLGLDPDTYRTDGGQINHLKVKAAIRYPNAYPRLSDCTHKFVFSAKLGGRVCIECGSPERTAPQAQPVVEPEMHDAKCPALTGGYCECSESPASVDKPWARFCGQIGRGPDAPYPGMIEAFELHYSQSFTDRDWRDEASVWAASWKAAKTHPAPQAQQPGNKAAK